VKKITYIRAPKDLSAQLGDLFERVARKLGVDPDYIGQVARGDRQSSLVEDALTDELIRIRERGAEIPYSHEVQFYAGNKVLLDRLVPFVGAALKRGEGAIVVATQSHRDSLVKRLKKEGLDVDAATKAGIYIALDAVSTLSMFMVNDMPESVRFFKVVGGLIEAIVKSRNTGKATRRRVALFGEGVSLLCGQGKADAAIRLEHLCSQLAINYDVDILCGCETSSVRGGENGLDFKRISAEHSAVYPQGI
jgi:hypothetical protein